ncbi:MAG: hypothetical protein LBH44_02925 [Treponema sp.]|jgi:hypothetical protein|nr:hypothetical protein [Treponema sp.]
MKKLLFILAIIFLAAGTASAQGWGNSVTVTGALQLQNGQVTIINGNIAYYCPMIERYAGFIDGLKEGNTVTIEGFAYGNLLQPVKITAGGKSYDFLANNNSGGFGGRCCTGTMAGGFCGRRGGRGRW